MSTKIAIASSDGVNVDLHFGKAREFLIYEAQNGAFVQIERRKVPEVERTALVEPVETAGEGEIAASGGFGCGSGAGCGSGCGGGGGGCGGGASGPLAPAVELLLDCRAIVAAQIGQNMGRQFQRNAISVFDIELPVSEALEKLAAYYKKFGDI